MANLTVDKMSSIVDSGDTERFFGHQSSVRSGRSGSSGVDPDLGKAQDSGDGGKTFSDILRDSVDQVNTYQHQADTAIKELVAGRTKNIHETMLTIERADVALKLMMRVRNKIMDAYKEIMRMQI